MKVRKLILPLALVLLVGIYFLLRTKEPVERTKSLIPVDSTMITGIDIINSNIRIEMLKKGDKWQIVKPFTWEASEYNISRLFREIIRIQVPRTTMAEGNDAIKRYGLTPEKAMQLKLYDANHNVLAHLYFGNIDNPNDYFRYEGSKEVFQIKEKVSNNFPSDTSFWRNTLFLSLAEKDMKRIEVEYPKLKYALIPGANSWLYKDSQNDFAIPNDNRAMMRTVSILSNLETQRFIDNPSREQLDAFDAPLSTVRVYLKDGTMRKLTFAKLPNDDFALMLDDNINVLFGVSGDTLERFTRYAAVFSETRMM